MKRIICFALSMMLVCYCLCGCLPNIMLIPSNDVIGDPKSFEKDGLTMTLTDKFTEQKSEVGFDAYFVSDFCGVVVLKESFTLQKGLSEMSTEDYINNVIKNNGHTDVVAQEKDGLWFYEKNSDARYSQSYSYKGSDAFWIVQFICDSANKKNLKDTFYLWAQSVEVK